MKRLLFCFFTLYFFIPTTVFPSSLSFEEFLKQNEKIIRKSSSKTVGSILQGIQQFSGRRSTLFLQSWKDKKLHYVRPSGRFVLIKKVEGDDSKKVSIIDLVTGDRLGLMTNKSIRQIKPNSGVRAKIASALVPIQLGSDKFEDRLNGLKTLKRNIQPKHLKPLLEAIKIEANQNLRSAMEKAYVHGILAYGTDPDEIEKAIFSLKDDLSLETRAALNPLLTSQIRVSKTLPQAINLAGVITPELSEKKVVSKSGARARSFNGAPELSLSSAYQMLVDKNIVPERISVTKRNESLVAYADNGFIGEYPLASLDTEEARDKAYDWLVKNKNLPPRLEPQHMINVISGHIFYAVYDNPSQKITRAAKEVLDKINSKVTLFKLLDLFLDGLSLASIYFLAAIGLAITFGVMRVINMAHGEFIMMGAYTGYVVQLLVPSYTVSIILAIPAAFFVTFIAGVVLERLVIRHLYKRPLETLLATFGISIGLQQIAKNIFGTQARPLTSPGWLDGAFVVNDVLAISNIRIAIFCLGILFLFLLIFVMTRTRFGLETRAVTQNPGMAASMGINPDRINMLTFGFGSGIAGIAGVAIGLYSKVTSELGSDYIVQSFMTVVVGGVGNIWGTLAGAATIGSLQKGIEWFNPSNTLAAQTYMIIFIILFIQFRPRGIMASKGRAAEE